MVRTINNNLGFISLRKKRPCRKFMWSKGRINWYRDTIFKGQMPLRNVIWDRAELYLSGINPNNDKIVLWVDDQSTTFNKIQQIIRTNGTTEGIWIKSNWIQLFRLGNDNEYRADSDPIITKVLKPKRMCPQVRKFKH